MTLNPPVRTTMCILTLPILVVLGLVSCGQDSKRLDAVNDHDLATDQPTGLFNQTHERSSADKARTLHSIQILDTIATGEYLYMRVKGASRTYWLSTLQQPIDMDRTYVHGEGVLLLDFVSRTLGRTFDSLYMVQGVLPADESPARHSSSVDLIDRFAKDRLPIATLVQDMASYQGKTILLSGEVVKVNVDIMERNWIHLRDGSQDDYDLVLTSKELPTVGDIVTMTGVVATNKDFGAGYIYEVIIEDAKLIK